MKEKEFRKLKKIDLYEIILAQSEEIDHLREQLDKTQKALSSKEIVLNEAGSIAEASLKLTSIFEEAQKAADIYLENVKEKLGDANAK